MTLMSGVVKTLDKITKTLKFQSSCTVGSFKTDGGVGDPVTPPTKYPNVIVTRVQRQVPTANGLFVTSTTTVLFFGKADIKPLDVITLADGSGGVVLSVNSPVDASGRLITEAYIA